MNVLNCVRCSEPFRISPGEEWKTLCIRCFKETRATRAAAVIQFSEKVTSEFKDHLPALIQLCHPDKHNGSSLATATAQWLNDIRRRLR